MAGAERRTEQGQVDLENLIEQGFSVVRGLRSEAELARSKIETAQSVGHKISNYDKSRLLEATADHIQEHLAFLESRLSAFL